MGEQRRYEEVSQLIDSLDVYSHFSSKEGADVGILAGITPRLEPSHEDGQLEECYIELAHKRTVDDKTSYEKYRFYEAYWAAITAGGLPWWSVLKWLLSQCNRPWNTLRSPWRFRQRLRRSCLHQLWADLQNRGKKNRGNGSYDDSDIAKMLDLYHDFERPSARREHRKGTFAEFLEFIRTENSEEDVALRQRLERLAKHWHSYYRKTEFFNQFVLLTIALSILLAAGFLLWSTYALLSQISSAWIGRLPEESQSTLVDYIRPTWKNVTGIVVSAASLFGITAFLGNFMGDVQMWGTYEETDVKYKKRAEIIERCSAVLKHVLCEPKIDRVVVVAHSLGTAVAVDTLLELGRHNRARNSQDPIAGPLPLEKLDILVTFGCPVDKIHYLFESYGGQQHRYIRMADQIRGDIGQPPFARNRKPFMHWINFWDRADLVSGPVTSPANYALAHIKVDNVRLSSFYFPDPAKSHTDYVQNREMIRDVFGAVFLNQFSFKNAELVENQGYDYDAKLLGPGKGLMLPFVFQIVMFAVPWAVIVWLTAYWSKSPAWCVNGTGALALATGVILALGWFFGSLRGLVHPLDRPRQKS